MHPVQCACGRGRATPRPGPRPFRSGASPFFFWLRLLTAREVGPLVRRSQQVRQRSAHHSDLLGHRGRGEWARAGRDERGRETSSLLSLSIGQERHRRSKHTRSCVRAFLPVRGSGGSGEVPVSELPLVSCGTPGCVGRESGERGEENKKWSRKRGGGRDECLTLDLTHARAPLSATPTHTHTHTHAHTHTQSRRITPNPPQCC